jgi:hypothetical protein
MLQGGELRAGQAQEMAVGHPDDRAPVGVVVGLQQARRGPQDHHAQHGEGGQGERGLDQIPAVSSDPAARIAAPG